VPFSTVGYSNPAGWGTSGQPGGSCRWSSTRQLRSADPPLRTRPPRGPAPPGPQQARPHPHVAATASPAARPATTAMAPPGPAGGDEDLCAAVGRPLRAWPTSKPSMTSGPRPALVCGAAPAIGSPCATPASPACSATWVGDRSRVFGAALAQTGVHHSPPGPAPQINGNMERLNRIPLDLVSPHDARTADRSTGPPHHEPPRVAARPGRSGRSLRRGRGPWRPVGG
jgi:hypothetical protein